MTRTYVAVCTHHELCEPNCNKHCGEVYGGKALNQAVMLKHVHISRCENHEVEIRDEDRSVVKIE